jgi:hypothetical protein
MRTTWQERLEFPRDAMLTTFDMSVPVSIAAVNITTLLILIPYVWAVREFSDAQQDEKEMGWFETSSDPSSILGFLAHTVSFRSGLGCIA